MNDSYKQVFGEVLEETAEALKTGRMGAKIKIGLTTWGSEVPLPDLVRGAEIAMEKDPGLQVSIIGPAPAECNLPAYKAGDEEEVHVILERLLDENELDGAVTMHYPFPVGVATVGKVLTPARGKVMYIASTTGMAAVDRIQAIVMNTVYGIAVARCDGVGNPSIGILNLDGARQAERYLHTMQTRGYEFNWGESQRTGGGSILRGNDLILGSVDVVVCDTLTGNLLMKLFSAFNSGGDYETTGYGYGPGVGENFNRLVTIISRASGTPVVANAISYCTAMVRGGLSRIKQAEIEKARTAGWLIPEPTQAAAPAEEEIIPPPARITDEQITGVDILEIDQAVKSLWREKIFASAGMGCTGPVILVAAEDKEKVMEILKSNQFVR